MPRGICCFGGLLGLASILLCHGAAFGQSQSQPRLFRAPTDVMHISQAQNVSQPRARAISRSSAAIDVPDNPLRSAVQTYRIQNDEVRPASAMQDIVEGTESDSPDWHERRHATPGDLRSLPVKLNAPNQSAGLDPVDDPFGDGKRSHSVLRGPAKSTATRLGANRLQNEDTGMNLNSPNSVFIQDKQEKPPLDKGEVDGPDDELPAKRKDDRKFKTDCEDVAKEVAAQTLIRIQLNTKPSLTGDDQIPGECPRAQSGNPWRSWPCQTFTFTASSLCHKPLYFEDIQLERYGHSAGPLLQPFKSTAHFFLRTALLPYQMGIHPPTECQYALGYYRPGDCAPWLQDPFPISPRGMLYEAGFAVGAAYVIP